MVKVMNGRRSQAEKSAGMCEGKFSSSALAETFATKRFGALAVLILVSAWAYFANLHLSLLEGSEGLYAGIAGEMKRRGEFFDLTYQGEPYFNKPPFFFWLLSLSTSLWGDNEVALRVPGSLAAVGTIALVYLLGVKLISPTAGFWAALVVATTHVFLWYGRRVLFDSTLTFFVTLALFSWIQVQLLDRRSTWYLLAFLSMAFGAMLKELHGFFLPLLVMAVYAVIQRDARMVKDRFFWVGLMMAVAMMAGYAQLLGPGYQHHFQLSRAVQSVWSPGTSGFISGGHPVYWYLGMMWADFFPWCALLPSAIVLLWARRPWQSHPTELLVLVWVLSFFVVFSLATLKREPYLMTLVPGIGLMIGYLYDRAFSPAGAVRPMPRLLKVMLSVLAIVFIAGMFLGAAPLRRRWLVSSIMVSPVFVATTVALAGLLIYAAVASRLRLALGTVGALAIAYAVLVVAYVFPAIDQAFSPRKITEELKTLAAETTPALYMYIPGWPKNEDAVYYLKRDGLLLDLPDQDALTEVLRRHGTIKVVTEEQQMVFLRNTMGLAIEMIREFQQPGRKHLLLISLRERV
jgi:4-amino-4-deoxy-L-arabinose transferase-like glycosyltransferase